MNNIAKSCLVLFLISAVCVTALAYANEITTEPIKKQDLLAENEAFAELFPGDGVTFEKDEKPAPQGGIITGITSVYKGGEQLGYIVRLAQKGYGGTINMMVGISGDGSVSAIKVLSHSETPGLGANAEQGAFTAKYKGKSVFPLKVIKSGVPGDDEIDAITSATITTDAVTDAVNKAYEWAASEGGLK